MKVLGESGCLHDGESGEVPPILLGGAVTFFNPFPFLPFVDAIILGEGEGKLDRVLEYFHRSGGNREQFLEELSDLPWIVTMNKLSGERTHYHDLSRSGGSWSVFFSDAGEFGFSFLVEIQRGCSHLCRFCGAGYTYLPPREIPAHIIMDIVESWGHGVDRVGLISPSPGDHPEFLGILDGLLSMGKKFTLSSMRADIVEEDFFRLVEKADLRSVTLAPEAGSNEERRELNKFIEDEAFVRFVEMASSSSIGAIKLYFIIGRMEDDTEERNIVSFLKALKDHSRGIRLEASISIFVPKPFTPFQWKGMVDMGRIREKMTYLRKSLTRMGVKVTFEDLYDAYLEGIIARSDYGELLPIFEGLRKFTPKRFVLDALDSEVIRNNLFSSREKEDRFPWERIRVKLKREFLWKEFLKSARRTTSPSCKVGICKRCGVCD